MGYGKMGFSLKKALGSVGKAVNAVATGGASLFGGSSNPLKNFGGANTLMELYNKANGMGGMSAKQMWDYQFDKMTAWEKEKALNGRAWDMQSLQNAGLNPALAASAGDTLGGGSPNPGEWTDAQNTSSTNSGLKLMEIIGQQDKMRAEIDQINNESEATKLNNDIVRKYGSAQAKQNLANTMLKASEIQANSALKRQEIQNKIAEEIDTRARTGLTLEKEVNQMLENRPLKRREKFHDNHPLISSAVTGYDVMRAPIKDIGSFAGMLSSASKLSQIGKEIDNKARKINYSEHYNSKGKFTGATKSWSE